MKNPVESPTEVEAKFTVADATILHELAKRKTSVEGYRFSELAAGVDGAELQVLADRFMGSYGLIPSTESKLERALRIISRHPAETPESWQGIGHHMHMGEACRIIWHEQFMAMLLSEAGVRHSADFCLLCYCTPTHSHRQATYRKARRARIMPGPRLRAYYRARMSSFGERTVKINTAVLTSNTGNGSR